MALDKIVSISGKPGLYKLLTHTRGGFIVQSLLDNKKMSIGLQKNVSVLSEIAIYTLTEEIPLKEVLKKIKDKENSKQTTISHKDNKDILEEYFFSILPDYDEDRVYASDIKKIIQWYNLLLKNDMLELLDDVEKDDTPISEEE